MSKTDRGLVNFALSQVGVACLYGAKGEKINQSLIDQWASLYPNIYTDTYIKKAQKFIGYVAYDCSGLISGYTGIIRNSQHYMDTAIEKLPINQISNNCFGWAVWKRGHIGVFIGDNTVVEARGIESGVIKTSVYSNSWTHIIQLVDIDYNSNSGGNGFKFEVKDFQKWMNQNYASIINENCGALLDEDNIYGEKTRNAALCIWKYQMNKLNTGYTFDLKNRYFGPKCNQYGTGSLVKNGDRGIFVYLAEGMLRAKKLYTGGLDGIAGPLLEGAIKGFQKANALTVDGECGVKTWDILFG
ncbi:peptidoglycan-binding domain-containing protein [Anaerosacchariphilus polymeriproducens]|uniref:Peptidoglycan-binding protein n=1 Tax=Anaerosacchariphilus polymeriproducens TaxID=1812858 RepID=A0A371AXS3_9FIRM|nr:peptidoglycan-binding protein [Anaerosacchariphilus polymeriproducens]RDU24378.1 peptidoglycan-binding protein [Anaerosacchariphilus polymeriproducens]